jgi:hypothetical protein
MMQDVSGSAAQSRAIVAVRWLLGVQCLLSGLNWWFKILPFPNMFEPMVGPMKHPILGAMIDSGWMFTAAKMIEISLGLSLILNRFSVLLLVLAFPVLMTTYVLDAIPFFFKSIPAALHGTITVRNFWASFLDMLFFGGGVFVMQLYLMIEWLADYRQLFALVPGTPAPRWVDLLQCQWLRRSLMIGSLTVGAASTLWAIGMVDQVIIPWKSLAVMAPSPLRGAPASGAVPPAATPAK